MPNYENINCPVCKRAFEQDDDIVTCPECGTPHHRECYNMVGKCVNQGLHQSNYSFMDEIKPKAEAKADEKQPKVGDYYTPLGTSTQKDESEEPKINSQLNPAQIINAYSNDKQTIDNNSVSDVASTIRTNIPHFVDKFKKMEQTGKKTSWNWGAFFFGGLYYLFRKMYKQGILFLSITTAITILSETLMMKFAPKFMQAAQDFALAYSNGNEIDPNTLVNIPQMDIAMRITYISFFVILLVRVIEAVFADYFYKKTVAEIIDDVNEKLSEGASFMQGSMMGVPPMDQNQMRQMYLGRKGGVSFFGPLTAYLVVYLITSLL